MKINKTACIKKRKRNIVQCNAKEQSKKINKEILLNL